MSNYIFKTLFIFIFLAAPMFANVGKIIAAKGNIDITRDGAVIKAKTGTILEEKDSIKTGAKAKMQIMFNDKTIITLGKNSEFAVSEYSFDDTKKSKASFKFGSGAFRTITGKIGKLNPKKFELKTKTATIGIRGTQFIFIIPPPQTDVDTGELIPQKFACTEGEIQLVNPTTGATVTLKAGEYVELDEKGNFTVPEKNPQAINNLAKDTDGGKAVMKPDETISLNEPANDSGGEKKPESKPEEKKKENGGDGTNSGGGDNNTPPANNTPPTNNTPPATSGTTTLIGTNIGTTTQTPVVPTTTIVVNTDDIEKAVDKVDEDVKKAEDKVDNATKDTTAPSITLQSIITNNNSPTISGIISEPATVVFSIPGSSVNYTIPLSKSGDFTINIGQVLPDGDYTITALATDAAGNAMTTAATGSITVDTVLSTFTIDKLITNSNTPELKGVTEAKATVTLSINGVDYEATADDSGNFTITLSGLADDTYNITGTATDIVGNSGTATSSITIDTVLPTLTIDGLETNINTPTIVGKTEAGATVEIDIDGQIYKGTADENGDFSITTGELGDNTYLFSGKVTDIAGNEGAGSATLLIDTINPDISISSAKLIKSLQGSDTLTITNTEELDIIYTITNSDGMSVSTGLVSDPGSFSIPADVADGTYTIVFTATDSVGNEGTATADLIIDVIAPTITLDTTELIKSINTTGSLTITAEDAVGGVLADGGTINYTITGSDGSVVEGTIESGSSFSAPDLDDGSYTIIFTVDDSVGNEGTNTANLIIDTVAPTVSASYSVNEDAVTISGTTEAGATVTIEVNGGTETTTTNDGSFSFSYSGLSNNTYSAKISAEDSVGNTYVYEDLVFAINVIIEDTLSAAEIATLETSPEDDAALGMPGDEHSSHSAVYISNEDPYLSWGFWATESMSEDSLDASKIVDNWVSGSLTPDSVLESLSSKTYAGQVKGLYTDTANSYSAIGDGTISSTVSFGSSHSIDGNIYYNVEKYGGGNENWNGKIDPTTFTGNGFSTTISDNGGDVTVSSGEIKGALYGPSANSIGGNFNMVSGNKKVDGMFIGKE